MRVIFMGTPDFSVPVLQALAARHEVVAVYCQPPRPAGRGKRDRPSPVQAAAEALALPVRHPLSLREPLVQAEFAGWQADVAVVVAYGLLLPMPVLQAPRLGCLNIHASLLPRWRGAAPVQRAILAGDRETGVCVMQMEAGLDTGPVLARHVTEIGAEDTGAEVLARLSLLGTKLICDLLSAPLPPSVPQPADGVTYAAKIDKAEARVDWTRSAVDIDHQIRALSPFPGAWCDVGGERVKLLRSRLAPGSGAPGQVLGGFRIACGKGAVDVTEAQREGRKPMQAAEVLRGWSLPERLG